MTVRITSPGAGLGGLRTDRGHLPLEGIDVRVEITGLTSQVELTQDFVNSFDVPLEASYVFPLPDRAAVTGMRVTADGRVVEAELREREAARGAYDEAVVSGRRASITEEDRPDVFTMRVGNILPGERVSVALTLVNPLGYEDGEATFRFPLVVAPRYIPGEPLADSAVGDGYADDTDAVPDASRITPPVLLPDFPRAVPLTIDVGIDPAGPTVADVRSSLPAVTSDDGRIKVQPGATADRDFILRLRYGVEDLTDSLVLVPDADGDEGTYQLTVLPPASSAPPRPRDVVVVLDRSGSMDGWKIVAARRAAARLVDALAPADRFAVLTFDDRIDRPAGLPDGLVEASDRNRYRAVEHLARVDARGGKELLEPLRRALALLVGAPEAANDQAARDALVVVVTDGQVGNEDQLLRALSSELRRVRVHAVGIDQAVNAGFLRRLTGLGGGRCELVESEDRLDEAMQAIHRRVGAPLAYSLAVQADGLATIEDTASPARLPDLVPGVPLVVTGRYRGDASGSLTLRGTTRDGADWSATAVGRRAKAAAVTAQWARGHVRDLEDRYASTSGRNGSSPQDLAKRIVDTSLRFGVLCRFTAYVALDRTEDRDGRIVAEGELRHRVLQPVELPAGFPPEPMVSVPASGTPKAPSAPRPHAGPRPDGSNPRMVKLRNVLALAMVGVLLLGFGWVWSGRDGLSTSTRDGVVAGKPSGRVQATTAPAPVSGGIVDNTVEGPKAPPFAPRQAPADTTYKRDVVTTGSVQLVVAEPTQVADRVVSTVTDAGGRVDSRSERSGAPYQSGSPTVALVLRIPSDKLDGVLADVKKLGTVESMSINRNDVTSQRVDLDARIEALQTSVTRLLDLMRRAGSVADLLAAESSLTQRQAELDSLRARREALRDEIDYTTINVSISAVPAVTHHGFLGALEGGWESLLSALRGVGMAVGFLIPWSPVLALLAFAVVVVRRRLARRGTGADGSVETGD